MKLFCEFKVGDYVKINHNVPSWENNIGVIEELDIDDPVTPLYILLDILPTDNVYNHKDGNDEGYGWWFDLQSVDIISEEEYHIIKLTSHL